VNFPKKFAEIKEGKSRRSAFSLDSLFALSSAIQDISEIPSTGCLKIHVLGARGNVSSPPLNFHQRGAAMCVRNRGELRRNCRERADLPCATHTRETRSDPLRADLIISSAYSVAHQSRSWKLPVSARLRGGWRSARRHSRTSASRVYFQIRLKPSRARVRPSR